MLDKPQFKSCYAVSIIKPDLVFLLSERDTICLQDRFVALVAALINGDRRSDDIIDAIQLQVLATERFDRDRANFFQVALDISIKAQAALFQLEKSGYLVDRSELLPADLITFCDRLNIDTSQAYQRLTSTKITVESVDDSVKADFIASLQTLHIQIATESDRWRSLSEGQSDLTIVLTDDYLQPNLAEFNRKSIESQIPWLLVKPFGSIIWLGPIFDPQYTACWQCLASRLQDNRPVASFVQRSDGSLTAPIAPQELFPATMQTALGMAATEVFKWIVASKNDRLTNTLITYDALTFQTRSHTIVKRPQCPSCGQISQEFDRQPLPVVLGHRQKKFTADGGHRYCSPQETLSKYQHHLSPITGIVRELTKLPGHHLNHTYIAKHHCVTIFDDVDNLRKNLGGRSAGKGRTDIQARASGFCEAIERYSGVWQGDEIRKLASFQKLGERAIHPNACMNFSQQQYENRAEWNTQCHGWFQKNPEPFDEEREIDWTPVWSLTERDFKYLPTAYCYYGYPQIERLDCWADSNGCASGNTIEEAILQGFMELVERDSVAIWWYNRLQKPQVDLDSFDDAYIRDLQQYYQELGRELWILDITSDLNIPTFAAISRRKDRPVEDIILGYGTHFDPTIALSRAVTELNQILPSVLSANADGTTHYPQYTDPLAIEWWKTATLAEHPYLIPDPKLTPKILTDYHQIASNDLFDDVKLCQKIVEEKNMQILVLDQTRPDIGLRVAKVIVPGLRHMWKRFGAGRLYEVPVEMGWLTTSLTEERLNAYPMWM
jgi:oxazoline/thiazoline synthase